MQMEGGEEMVPEGAYVPGVRSSAQLHERLDDLPG
jgi:hypothetical protein